MRSNRGRTLLAAIVISISLASGLVYFVAFYPTKPVNKPREIVIHEGMSFRHVAALLKANGIIRSEYALILWAEFSGKAPRIKPGVYQFSGGESLEKILGLLVHGGNASVTVTIPEGLTVRQIAQRFERAGILCQADFIRAAQDSALVRALGLGPMGAEGFLFPATYRIYPGNDATRVVAMMLERFFAMLTPPVEERMFELGLDQRQVVTLASIIEKEARVPGERPLIASVFYNRLKRGMPLQSDPTAQYNPEGETQSATLAVHMPSRFNTYDFVGLPPGPIANPGASSIYAALYPARSDYLYFVARGDGTHIFSRTLRQHERAIAMLRQQHVRIGVPKPDGYADPDRAISAK
jgi:UPF0755 protein